jgi:hypothetical protein
VPTLLPLGYAMIGSKFICNFVHSAILVHFHKLLKLKALCFCYFRDLGNKYLMLNEVASGQRSEQQGLVVTRTWLAVGAGGRGSVSAKTPIRRPCYLFSGSQTAESDRAGPFLQNRDILASRRLSSGHRDSPFKTGTVPAKPGRLVTLPYM